MQFVQWLSMPSFWFDIVCVIFFIVLCARYVRLGFLAAVTQILGTVLSLFGAYFFATACDSWVYNTFFAKALTGKVQTMVVQSGTTGIEELTSKLLTILPQNIFDWQNKWLDFSGVDLSNDIDHIVTKIMQSTVEPIITQVIFMVLFFLGFIICRVLVHFLVQLLRVANYLPIIGSINRVLGWVIGVLGSCIDLFLIFCLLWVFMLLTDGIVPVLNATDLEPSLFFALFKEINPFL